MTLRRALLISTLVLVGISLLIATAYAVAGRPEPDRAAPGVMLAGKPVAGVDRSRVEASVAELAGTYATGAFSAGSGDRRFSAPTASIDLVVNQPATVDGVMAIGRTGSVLSRIGGWLGGIAGGRQAPVAVEYNEAAVRLVVRVRDPGERKEAVEPALALRDGQLVGRPGENGNGMPADEVIAAIPAAVAQGAPLHFEAMEGTIRPRFDDRQADELARDVNARLRGHLGVGAGTARADVAPITQREWVVADVAGPRMKAAVDPERVTQALPQVLAAAGTPPVDAAYTIIAERPVFADGRPGTACCAPEGVERVVAAVEMALADTPSPAVLDLPMRPVPPKKTKADEPQVGIREKVAEFTTNYVPGQPRVKNIQRIADMMRGHVILPGETLSVNGVIGPRTVEKGFVVDHVIHDAKFTEAVGGGISQFTTTLFNAAFMGGLDFQEYMAHTIYIDRYPFGREATISFPRPDLKIRNTTPHGMLVWPTYTGRSVTVALYSTRFVTGQQTNQSQAPEGACMRVTTERTRTYVDNRPPVVDQVTALYQPAEGVKC